MGFYIGDTGYGRAVALGKDPSCNPVHKFGCNLDVGTALEDIWVTGGLYVWLQAGVQIEAISGSALDKVDSTGARKIIVAGLDDNFLPIQEEIEMNGLVVTSATTALFRRIHRAWVSEGGAYGATNVAAITIRTVSVGATHITMTAGVGQSQVSRYTIAANKIGLLSHWIFTVESLKTCDFFLVKREDPDVVAVPFAAKRMLYQYNGVGTPLEVVPSIPLYLSPKTDIWMQADAAAINTVVTGDMIIEEHDDPTYSG